MESKNTKVFPYTHFTSSSWLKALQKLPSVTVNCELFYPAVQCHILSMI